MTPVGRKPKKLRFYSISDSEIKYLHIFPILPVGFRIFHIYVIIHLINVIKKLPIWTCGLKSCL